MDYMEDLIIDEHQLDQEWLRQPITFMRYCEAMALAEDERDKARRAVEVAKAEADNSVREAALESGEKLTEAKVSTRVVLHPLVVATESQYLEANKRAKLLGGAVKSFDQRKKALEKLSELFIAGYFSAPKGDKTKKTSGAINDKLNDKMKQEKNNE